MSLDRIEFPAKPANPVTALLCKIGRWESNHPIAARWVIVGLIAAVIVVSAVVERAA